MTDPRVENLAKILIQYSTGVKPGDWVLVAADTGALPLVQEVVRYLVRAGAHYNLILRNEDISEIELCESSEEQLSWVSPVETMLYEQADVLINLPSSVNTRALTGIDPKKMQARQIARRGLMQTYMTRAAEGSLRWVLCQYPSQAYAQDADMSLRAYEDFLYSATFADQPDPVACWQSVHDRQERLIHWLKGKREVTVRSPNCDLRLSVEGRTFKNSNGHFNMPDGEIFTGPVENSAQGWVKFTYPAVREGREVTGVELEFQDGKVVSARAQKNEDYLHAMLDMDPGARYLGEFAIGTNYSIQRFTKNILFDEKIGGSFHMAVGAGYPETGSVNRSTLHWDFICDLRKDSEIRVDGELFYKDGEFQVG